MQSPFVRPLEDDWKPSIDAVAKARGWPTTGDTERVARQLARLSEAYNDPAADPKSARESLPARLAFSFARDVPKGAAAVRELVATGALTVPAGRPLRVLDLGAGLGATTWGVARALEAAGAVCEVEAVWVDADKDALEVAVGLVAARQEQTQEQDQGQGKVGLRTKAICRSLVGGAHWMKVDGSPFDLVLLGQVLSELERERDGDRVARHAELLADLIEQTVDAHGSLVVIEPALRDRTRHLHRVRDAVLAMRAATLFAPCLHAAPCPALARPGDWCHEDLAVDLPSWLVPIARGAGLRWQGLTFSYVVFRKDGRTLAEEAARAGGARLRAVSSLLVSKGKKEVFVCGELSEQGSPIQARARAMRLDRDETSRNRDWSEIERGDLIAVEPLLDANRPRLGSGHRAALIDLGPVTIDGGSSSR